MPAGTKPPLAAIAVAIDLLRGSAARPGPRPAGRDGDGGGVVRHRPGRLRRRRPVAGGGRRRAVARPPGGQPGDRPRLPGRLFQRPARVRAGAATLRRAGPPAGRWPRSPRAWDGWRRAAATWPAPSVISTPPRSSCERIGSGLGFLWIDRCWALLAGHLASEARALAGRAAEEPDRRRYGIAGAEALAMQAEAALLDGARRGGSRGRSRRPGGLRGTGPPDVGRLRRLPRPPGPCSDLENLDRTDLEAIRAAASALEEAGMRDLALHARRAVRAHRVAPRRHRGGAADLGRAARARHAGSVVLRVQAWLATALLRLEQRRRQGAASAVHAGIAVADQYGAALGALEARAGISAHAEELAALGLRLALDSGRPRRIFEWMERSRARALDFPSVVPPEDAELAALLSRLRLTDEELRNAELGGDDTARLRRESSDCRSRSDG